MEILFSILCAVFAILASVFGVRNRIRNSKLGDGSGIRNSRARLNDIIHNYKRTERDKNRISELDRRDDEDNILPEIDDELFHPDALMALLYACRQMWFDTGAPYGGESSEDWQ